MANTRVLEAARRYTAKGISVIPVNPLGHKKPKGPAIDTWKEYQHRIADEEELDQWFGNGSGFRVAILGGRVSKGLVIVDVDDLDLAERIRDDEDFMEGQVYARTPSGGLHLFFRTRDEVHTRPYPSVEEPQGEIRSRGAYVVAPPSTGYQWEQTGTIPVIRNWEKWWADFTERFGIGEEKKSRRMSTRLPPIIREGRHNLMVREATRLHYKNTSDQELYQKLSVIDQERCKPPLGDKELRRLVIWTRTLPERIQWELSDIGNGKRLVARYGENIRWSPGRGWFIWTGRRWRHDALGQIFEMAKETVASIEDESDDDSVQKWGHVSASMAKLEAMVKAARTEPGVAVDDEQFDSDPWLLNVGNGTLDLRTGTLKEPERDDYITKQLTVPYEDVAGPTFDRFIRQILPNRETRLFVQRLLGYSITGDVREQVFPIFYGSGGNGKSTLNNAVIDIMGEYAKQAPAGLFMQSRNQRDEELALGELHGTRMVFAFENREGERLSESLVKQVTGGDKLKGRRLYHDPFDFTPTHHVFLVTNHLPVIGGTDSGIWRRVLRVPFGVEIPKAKQDGELPKLLKEEYPAILKWLVQGCMAWQRDGLKEPEEVRVATDEYRGDSDLFGQFISEQFKLGEGLKESNRRINTAYERWCARNRIKANSSIWVGRQLAERGFIAGRTKRRERGWLGLQLTTTSEPAAQKRKRYSES